MKQRNNKPIPESDAVLFFDVLAAGLALFGFMLFVVWGAIKLILKYGM